MDPSILCRSCMKEVAPWDRENFDERVVYMFSYSTNIQIPQNDILPKQFCYDCTNRIESSFIYIKEAQHNHEVLTNLLTHRTVIVDPTNRIEPELEQYDDDVFEDPPATETAPNEPEITPVNAREGSETVIKGPIKETIENESTVKHVCSVCNKMFLSKVWFEKHMQKQHDGKIFQCPQCPKSYKKPSQLSVHAVTHSNERRYACPCGKRYKRRKELAVHSRTHSPTRPFQCDHCNMRYRYRSF